MVRIINRTINKILGTFNYKIVRKRGQFFDRAMEDEFVEIYEKCKGFTETSVEKMYALYMATRYIVGRKIPGALVECGVYKGGSAMVMAQTLNKMKVADRKIYLYDTFAGMSEPSDQDISFDGIVASEKWKRLQKDRYNQWVFSPVEDVQRNVYSTGYPKNNFHFVKGKVEETVPQIIPEAVSLLRLDTDWFESTYHELKFLYPRLSPKGIIIIDDYGAWKGSQKAVDAYFKENGIETFLQRIDPEARMGVKS